MSDIEKLADKFGTARNTVKNAYLNQYPEVISPYSESIKRRMLATGEGELLATLECAKGAADPLGQLKFLAAGMEMVAPSQGVA